MAIHRLDELWHDDTDEKLYRRTGQTMTEVSPVPDISGLAQLSEADVARNDDPLIIYDTSAGSHKKIMPVDVLYPVGSFYVQYPDAGSNTDTTEFPSAKSPATLYGGTWAEQWSTESVFFRTRGTLSDDSRVSGLQPHAFMKHQHRMSDYAIYYRIDSGSRGPASGSTFNYTTLYTSGYYDDGAGTPKTGNETRPENRRIKVWKRTA